MDFIIRMYKCYITDMSSIFNDGLTYIDATVVLDRYVLSLSVSSCVTRFVMLARLYSRLSSLFC